MLSLRVAVEFLLTLKVNSRSLGDTLGVSHGTVCRWRLEVTRRLALPGRLGILDAPLSEIQEVMDLELNSDEADAEGNSLMETTEN